MKKNVFSVLVALALLVGLAFQATPARASTLAEIQTSIDAGLAYLAGIQNADGSWSGASPVGITCASVAKFQDRAYELGYSSPWDPTYPYTANVTKAYEYIFANAHKQTPLAVQTAGDPDTNGNGYGVWFAAAASAPTYSEVNYETGLCLMAMASSKMPDHPNEGGLDFDGDTSPDTFGELSQEGVDFLAWSQNDTGANAGGWRYGFNPADADGSVSGFATLGLAYAENFGATVPAFVKSELIKWITYDQCADGGAGYTACPGSNLYRTGHLITMMAFVGDTPATPRMDNALTYIEDNWALPLPEGTSFLGTWSLMKGLSYAGVNQLDLDADGTRDDEWFNADPTTGDDLATYTIGLQQVDGGWGAGGFYEGSSAALKAAFALLVLERAAPPPPNTPPVAVNDAYNAKMTTQLDGSTVLGNDTDANSDPLTAVLVTEPGHDAAFTFNADGTFSYTPENGFQGLDTFTYKANDGSEDSNEATVSITVSPNVRTYISNKINDGWVRESSENSNVGDYVFTDMFLRVGDNALNKQYRSILSFPTQTLLNDAVILKATVKIMQYTQVTGTDPFTTHGSLWVDIKKGSFGAPWLEAGDFQAPASKPGVGVFNPVAGEPGWYQMVLGKANYQYIDWGGVTQFRLRFALDDNNNGVEDMLRFFGGESTVVKYRPMFVVEYYFPLP